MPYYKYITYITEARSPTRYTTASFNAAVQVANHYYLCHITKTSQLFAVALTLNFWHTWMYARTHQNMQTLQRCESDARCCRKCAKKRKCENAVIVQWVGAGGPIMIRRVAIAWFVSALQHLHPLEDHDDAEYDDATDDARKNDCHHYLKRLQLQDLSRCSNTCIHLKIMMMMLNIMMLMMLEKMMIIIII